MKGKSTFYMEEMGLEAEQRLRREVVRELNGHFLFNALTVIMVVTQEEPLQARTLQKEFGVYLRGAITQVGSVQEWIPLSEEMKMVRAYLHIQNVRFMDRFTFESKIDNERALVPSGVLRHLVENAVGHGLCQKNTKGWMRIDQEVRAQVQHLHVMDDGVGFDTSVLNERAYGGIRRALCILEQIEGAQLTISSRPGSGTHAELTLPLRFGEDADFQYEKGR
jgi:LytS/YehU family sensor histidine kinase